MDPVSFLYGLQQSGAKFQLENIRAMLERLGHPERTFKSVHVGGTNGKGSVVAMIANVLQEAGYSTGRYTSPHLHRLHERISVDGQEIGDDELERHVRTLREHMDDIPVTFFEAVTAVAFLHFAERPVDYAVVEVGLGGRLDATNLVVPELAVITNVSLDHTNVLGATVREIAGEKAGIMKPGVPLVTAAGPEALEVFRSRGEVIRAQDAAPFRMDGRHMIVDGIGEIAVPPGAYQRENACTAIAACRQLGLPADAIARGLARTVWPGRFEVLSEEPFVVADGAHNVAGMRALRASLPVQPDVIVLAFSERKDVAGMVEAIVPGCRKVIVTKGAFKPERPDVIAECARMYCDDVEVIEDVDAAVGEALLHGSVLIAGSLYMLPDAITAARAHLPTMRRTPDSPLPRS